MVAPLPSFTEGYAQWAQGNNAQASADYTNARVAAGVPQAEVDLQKAQTLNQQASAKHSQAAADYAAAQTVGQNLTNETNAMALASIKALRVSMQKAAEQFGPGAPAAPGNTTGSQAAAPAEPPAQGQAAPAQAPAQQLPPPANPVEGAAQTLTVAQRLPNGQLNMFSDDYIAKVVEMGRANGVLPTDLQNFVKSTITERNKMAKDAADAAKAGGDAQEAIRKTERNNAWEIYSRLNPDFQGRVDLSKADPRTVGDVVASAKRMLNLDITTPDGQARFTSLALSSESAKDTLSRQREGANTASEIDKRKADIAQRAQEINISQQNANTSRLQAATAQGQLSVTQAKAAQEISQAAGGHALALDNGKMILDRAKTLETWARNGEIKQGASGALFVTADALKHLPGGIGDPVRAATLYGLSETSPGSKQYQINNVIDVVNNKLGDLATQALSQGGFKSAGGSDNRVEMVSKGAGKVEPTMDKATMLQSLNTIVETTQSINDFNKQLLKASNANGKKAAGDTYHAIKPAFEMEEPPKATSSKPGVQSAPAGAVDIDKKWGAK